MAVRTEGMGSEEEEPGDKEETCSMESQAGFFWEGKLLK